MPPPTLQQPTAHAPSPPNDLPRPTSPPRSPPDEILILRSPPQYPIPLGPVMCRPPLMQKPPEVDGGHSETDIPTSLKLKRDFFSASRSVRPDWARCSSCLSLKSDDVDTRGGNMSTVKAGDISSVHRLSEQVLPPALQVLPAQPTPPPRLMLPVPPSNPGGPHRTRARDLLERLPLQVIPVLPVEPSKVCENRNANTFPAKAINTADFPYQSSNTFNGLSCGSPLFTNSNPNGSANQAFSTRCSQGLRSGPGRGRFLSDDTPYTPHDDGSPLCVRCGGGGLFPEVLTRRGSSAAPSADILLPPLASLLVGVGEAHVPLRRYGSENPSADNSNDAGGAMANATHADWRYSQGEMVVEHLDNNNSLEPSVVFSVSSEASAEEQEERDVQLQEEWLREGEHPQASSTWVDDADAFHSSWTSCHKAGVSPLPAGANNNAPLPVKVVCSSSSSRFQPVGDGGGGEVCASPILFAPLDAMMAMNNGSNMLGHTSHGDEEDEVSTYLDGAAHEPEPYPECMWSAPTVALLRTRSFVSRNFDVLAPNGGGNRRNRYESVYDWLDVVTAQKSFTSLPTVAELCDSQMATHPLQQQQQQPIPVGTMESGPTTEDSMRVFSLAHDSKREETRSTVTGGAESQIKTICRKLTS